MTNRQNGRDGKKRLESRRADAVGIAAMKNINDINAEAHLNESYRVDTLSNWEQDGREEIPAMLHSEARFPFPKDNAIRRFSKLAHSRTEEQRIELWRTSPALVLLAYADKTGMHVI